MKQPRNSACLFYTSELRRWLYDLWLNKEAGLVNLCRRSVAEQSQATVILGGRSCGWSFLHMLSVSILGPEEVFFGSPSLTWGGLCLSRGSDELKFLACLYHVKKDHSIWAFLAHLLHRSWQGLYCLSHHTDLLRYAFLTLHQFAARSLCRAWRAQRLDVFACPVYY